MAKRDSQSIVGACMSEPNQCALAVSCNAGLCKIERWKGFATFKPCFLLGKTSRIEINPSKAVWISDIIKPPRIDAHLRQMFSELIEKLPLFSAHQIADDNSML